MKLLLDTNVLLWWLKLDKRLCTESKTLIQDRTNEVLVSSVVIWEIAIKLSLDKIEISMEDVENAINNYEFTCLPITSRHAIQYSKLPLHHRDPFDRMLIAQSMSEAAFLLTSDTNLAAYGNFVMVV